MALQLHINLHDDDGSVDFAFCFVQHDGDVDMCVSCVLPSSASAADVCDISRCFIVGCDADRICVLL